MSEANDLAAGVERRTLEVSAREREFYVYRPPGRLGALPTVLVLHGGGGQALNMRHVGFERLADREGACIVYPQGWNRGWNDGRQGERILRRAEGADDVAFFAALLDALTSGGDADPRRIYATGPSNGGMMSFRIALEFADRVAAVAPVIANMMRDCMHLRPSRPIPVFIINGVADPLVPWAGGAIAGQPSGGIVVSVDDTLDFWRAANGCGAEAVVRRLPKREPAAGTETTEFTWHDAKGVPMLKLLRVDGGGHAWHGTNRPGTGEADVRGDPISHDFDAVEETWAYFARFALRG
jgi:polyhydroxybutyrate depolymerase